MAITSYSGILVDGRIPSEYTGSAPAGGTLIEGRFFSINTLGGSAVFTADTVIDNIYASRKDNSEVMLGDYSWAVGYSSSVWKVVSNTHGNLNPSYDIEYVDDYFVYNTTEYWYPTSVITAEWTLPSATNKPALDGLVFALFLPTQITPGDFTAWDWSATKDSAIRRLLSTKSTLPRLIWSGAEDDYIPYQTGKYRVVYSENLDDESKLLTNQIIGTWKAYEFNDESTATTFLETVMPPQIDTIISIPGPGIIGIIHDPDTGVITTIIAGDVTGVDMDTGDITIDGEIYTGEDIPDDITTLIPETITADTLSTTKLMPKMWRSRTITTQPGITQGHEPMYLSTGISMNEMKGQRMMDIFTRMPSSNPNTRD